VALAGADEEAVRAKEAAEDERQQEQQRRKWSHDAADDLCG